jgi:hypothetical protein
MKFLHYELQVGPLRCVEVTLDKQASVKVMDSVNFSNYKFGKQHKFYGGYVTKSPVKVTVPSAGTWHVVVDLGAASSTIKASVRTM